MAGPTSLYAAKLVSANQAITQLETGTPSVTLDGRTYTSSDLPALYAIRDWLAVKAALEAVETGAQGYAIGGRSVSRADYEQLESREPEDVARLGLRQLLDQTRAMHGRQQGEQLRPVLAL